MNKLKTFLSLFLMGGLLVGGSVYGAAYDAQVIYRNSSDTGDVPTLAENLVKDHFALLGHQKDSDATPAYYYPNEAFFDIYQAAPGFGTNNYVLDFKQSLLDAKANQTELLDFEEDVVNLQIWVDDAGTFLSNLHDNFIGAHDNLLATSLAQGLMSSPDKTKLDALPDSTTLQSSLDSKQATLVSGTNIKTVGGTSLLGSGNIPLTSGTVTSITAGTGLSGGTITSTGTISMPNTGTTGTYSGVTTDAQGRVTAGTTRSVNNAPGRSIVTGTGATGFQISSTRDSNVSYSSTIVTTATIGGSQSGTLVLETATTNSATPGDWVEIGRCTNGQAITLALTLQSVQTIGCQLSGYVPASYYVKIRSINNAGTPSFTYNSGQEVLQ